MFKQSFPDVLANSSDVLADFMNVLARFNMF